MNMRDKLHINIKPSAHRYIFIIACLCFAVALLAANSLAERDRARHAANYERYEAANKLFEDMIFDEAYVIYKELAPLYSDSYILELKMAVCAMHMEMWAEAVEHSRRTLALRPLFAKDEDFMHGISYSLREIGETEAADRIDEYYYGFAAHQIQE